MSLELIAKRALALYQKYWMPVGSFIVLVNPNRPAWNLPESWQGGGMSVDFRFSVKVVRTWLLDPRVILDSDNPVALPWVPTFRATEKQSREAWRRIGKVEPEDVRRRLEAEFRVLAGLRYNEVEIGKMLGGKHMLLSPYVVSESSVVKPLLEESRSEGLRQGIEQGIEQGIQRGRVGEARQLLRVVLGRRFPGGDFPGLDLIVDLDQLESLMVMAVSGTRQQVASQIRVAAKIGKGS